MRTLAGILLAAALFLSLSGFIECFPGVQERAWKAEVQRLSADGRPSEILSHVQSDYRQARDDRIQTATGCFLVAGLLFYLGRVATTRVQIRLLHLQCIGSLLLSAALLLGFYGIVECFPSGYELAWNMRLQSLSADTRKGDVALYREERKSELAFNLQLAREGRIQAAIACFMMASLLLFLRCIARSGSRQGRAEPFRRGPIILPAKPRLVYLQRFSASLFGRVDRIQSARLDLRPKLETLFEHHAAKEENKPLG
jgi:hypothetical protein